MPVIVITHFHADHLAGLTAVLDSFPVGRVVISREAPDLPSARMVHAAASSHGVPVVSAVAGERWQVGQVGWHTIRSGPVAGALPAVEATNPENSSENDASVMGVATVGEGEETVRVLLAGDSEPDAQRAALRSLNGDTAALAVDVMAMPHHGSSRQERRFWQAAQAEVAVASSGVDNDYGHPSAKAIDLAHSLGMTVAATNEQGSVAIRRHGDRLVLVSDKAPRA